MIQVYQREDFPCHCSTHQIMETPKARTMFLADGHYFDCEAKEAAQVANQLLKQRVIDNGLAWCPHPACGCVSTRAFARRIGEWISASLWEATQAGRKGRDVFRQ
jgi:hypothetical protein